jgi:hypothetical protein
MISMIITFADIYRLLGLHGPEGDIHRATDFIYFSVITWTTVGYGDNSPSPESRIYAAAEAMTGYITMGIFLAFLFYMVSSRRPHS